MMSRRITAAFLALAVSGFAAGATADPPARAGRLSYLQGEIVLQSESGAPEEAELNRPLTLGDRLMTSRDSRAELSLGTAAVRLDESTDILVANLDHDIAQIELNSGTLGIHVRELGEREIFEIVTPNAVVSLRRPGDYRVSVDAQSATVLAVRNGLAELDGGDGPLRLADRQALRFTGVEQRADVTALGPLDAFDEWTIDRERAVAHVESVRYVSREVVGYEDLDRHGRWWSEPGYGYVWAPRVAIAGWAPYRFGHWTWISPWGWTWIDHAPWGFAPFHFGRWAFIRHRWCWVPGPRRHRPVYGPAHVAWQSDPHERGPRPGEVSWLPLAPSEVYVPLRPASPRYLRNVNVSNTTIEDNARITNTARNRVRDLRFANRAAPGAVTTMTRRGFDAPRAATGRLLAPRPAGRELTSRVPAERRASASSPIRTLSRPDRYEPRAGRNSGPHAASRSRSSVEARSSAPEQASERAERPQTLTRGRSGRSGVSTTQRR